VLTQRVFPGTQGSGIPQTIAALHMHDQDMVDRVLSLRIATGKVLLTLLGLASGASIGHEGPTVQVGASMMHALGKLLRLPRLELRRALVRAGGAAGIAAAFNTPLAGIVFAIEELSHSFETRTSGTVFTAVVVAGATTLGLVGSYTYFGQTSAMLANSAAVLALILCSVTGGLAGGLISQALIIAAQGLPGRAGKLIVRNPVWVKSSRGMDWPVSSRINPRSNNPLATGGTLGCLACGPPRQVLSGNPSATVG
jgi:H+/Cl- antiporter ClcA